MITSFDEYQSKYHPPLVFKDKIYAKINFIRSEIHRSVSNISETLQLPNLFVKVMEIAFKALSYINSLNFYLSGVNHLFKQMRHIILFIMGLQSVDGLINFKPEWKKVALNVSGFVLFILSALSVAEMFSIDTSVIKTAFKVIPIFGVLPYAGLVNISLSVIFGTVFLMSLDKRSVIKLDEDKIKRKIALWKSPLHTKELEKRSHHYEKRISELKKRIEDKKSQLSEGEVVLNGLLEAKKSETNSEMKRQSLSEEKLTFLKNELNVLHQRIAHEKNMLSLLSNKEKFWNIVDKTYNDENKKYLQYYHMAKVSKWEKKLNRLKNEKVLNVLSTVNSVVNISIQILFVGSTLFGVGLVVIPFVTLALAGVSAAISVVSYRIKKSVIEMKIQSVTVPD